MNTTHKFKYVRLIAAMIAAAVLLLVAVGCGSSDSPAADLTVDTGGKLADRRNNL